MPPSIGLFSRRKNSEDKALRTALTQVDPYTSSSSTLTSHLQSIPQPPHSAPLPAFKKKTLPKPPPIVSGFAAENAGLVFAPHLSRARTSTFDDPSNPIRSRKPLIRSSSSGLGRRTKSFDQRPPIEYVESPTPLRCQSSAPPHGSAAMLYSSPPTQPPPPPPQAVNFSRSVTPRGRAPLATSNQNVPSPRMPEFYSPVSGCSEYPVSPPLSPERGDGGLDGVDYSEVQGNYNNVHSVPENDPRSTYANVGSDLSALNFETPTPEPALVNPDNTQQQNRRREFELVDAVKGKERELEFLRSNSHGYREQIAIMEQALAQKDEELEGARARIYESNRHQVRNRNTPMMMGGVSEMGLADIGRKLMEEIRRRERVEKQLVETTVRAKVDMDKLLAEEEKKREEIREVAWREFEDTLHREERMRDEVQRKSRENLQSVLGEEERRRAELNWVFGEKIEKIENLRRSDLEEFQNKLAALKDEKERLEKQIRENSQELEQSRQSVRMQREANEELLEMTKKINTRLGEEKKKNRYLEEKINQITEDALNSVSNANREVFMLKNVVEDKDTKIQFFETELAAVKKDKKAVEEAWADMEAELEEGHRALLDRDERVKDLEEENIGVADRLEAYRKELDEFKQKITGNEQTPELEHLVKTTELLREDIELYKKDVKAYKKDVKKRDNHIKDLNRSVAELESLLESKTLETKVLQGALDASVGYREDSPSSTDSSGSESTPPLYDEITPLQQKIQMYEKEYRAMHDDYETLKKKHNLFVSQQAIVITEIDGQLTRVKKEKDAVEAAALRQLKKMQHGFLQLSQTAVAGQLAGIGGAAAVKKYHETLLPYLPSGSEDVPSSLKRSNTSLNRAGSKVKVGKRSSSEKNKIDIPPVTGPTGGMEVIVKAVDEKDLGERVKQDRSMAVVYEPDDALEEEEVIEW